MARTGSRWSLHSPFIMFMLRNAARVMRPVQRLATASRVPVSAARLGSRMYSSGGQHHPSSEAPWAVVSALGFTAGIYYVTTVDVEEHHEDSEVCDLE